MMNDVRDIAPEEVDNKGKIINGVPWQCFVALGALSTSPVHFRGSGPSQIVAEIHDSSAPAP